MKPYFFLIFILNLNLRMSYESCVAATAIESGLSTSLKETILANHN